MQLVENSANPLLAQDEKVLSGLFAEIGTFNQNGRRYPEEVYTPAYEELIPKIKEKRLLGELDHPMDYDEIRLSNVSHVITDCEIIEDEGVKKIYGSVELLDTPAGLVAQALVKAGIPLGISSRGLGATKQVRDGVDVTQLKLITYDLVADPSFSNAILSPDKSNELSDSLHYIESKLPLNESVETQSIRDMIHRIRESLIERKTTPDEEINIYEVELNSVKSLLESSQETIKSDTQLLISSRKKIKDLKQSLKESEEKYKQLMKNMFKLQESYTKLQESSISKDDFDKLRSDLVESQKQLAVEKRGMSYSKVSELLEGATTEEEIESRLNSLSSISRTRQAKVKIDNTILTEGKSTDSDKRLKGLAAIVSKV